MATGTQPPPSDIRVEPITTREEAEATFDVAVATFCLQTKDPLYMARNPGWDTPEGRAAGAKRIADRWESATRNRNGDRNTVFMQATVPAPGGGRKMIGAAIWQQLSAVQGFGDDPAALVASMAESLETLCPGTDAAAQAYRKFLRDSSTSLNGPRDAFVAGKKGDDPPAVLALDFCAVDPAYQGLGAAKKLVAWGIREAERRGNLEMTTEGSTMGRGVYGKLGFEARGEVAYVVDEAFRDRPQPSNMFMTRRGGLPLDV